MQKYTVKTSGALLPTLQTGFPDFTRTKIKQLLKYGAIAVNDRVRTKHDFALQPGDRISIHPAERKIKEDVPLSFPLLYEDEELLVIDKPPGLLTMGTDKERMRTAYFQLTEYMRSKSRSGKGRIFIVHRLDRDASGVLVFAKTEEIKVKLQEDWGKAEKKYYAIVEGKPKKAEDEIESFLTEDKFRRVYSTHKSATSKLAVTKYRVLKSGAKFSLLEVSILTGRKNQIRVHLADLGHPIVGDKKYKSTADPARRLGLHAFSLEFDHPRTGQKTTFTSEMPKILKQLVDRF